MHGVTGMNIVAAEFMRGAATVANLASLVTRQAPQSPFSSLPARAPSAYSSDVVSDPQRAHAASLCGLTTSAVTDHKSRYGVLHFLPPEGDAAAAIKTASCTLRTRRRQHAPAQPLRVRFF
jgi:hypothetical protein